MAYMARWGPKGFLVSPSKVVPFDGFSTDMKLKADSENDTSGTEPTNTRGRELRTISFETRYYAALGVDPRAQIEEWESLIGQSYPLTIGSKRFGPPKMTLKQVSTSEVQLTSTGEMISCKIAISMEEYSEGKTSPLIQTASAASSGGSAAQAMNATASKSDKAAKNP